MRPPGSHRNLLGFVSTFVAALFAFVLSPACGTGEQFMASGVVTSTVTVGAARKVVIDTPVPITVRGEPRLDDAIIRLEATITASTSTRAQQALDELEVAIARPDTDTLAFTLLQPANATLSGLLFVRLPADLSIDVIERNGTVAVSGMEGDTSVASLSDVQLMDLRGNTIVRVDAGNVFLDTRAPPGTTTDVRVGAGSIQVTLPPSLSVDLVAQVQTQGQIVVNHPLLPRALNNALPYRATIAGGLASVALVTRQGQILIGTR